MDVAHTETLTEVHAGLYYIVGLVFVAQVWQVSVHTQLARIRRSSQVTGCACVFVRIVRYSCSSPAPTDRPRRDNVECLGERTQRHWPAVVRLSRRGTGALARALTPPCRARRSLHYFARHPFTQCAIMGVLFLVLGTVNFYVTVVTLQEKSRSAAVIARKRARLLSTASSKSGTSAADSGLAPILSPVAAALASRRREPSPRTALSPIAAPAHGATTDVADAVSVPQSRPRPLTPHSGSSSGSSSASAHSTSEGGFPISSGGDLPAATATATAPASGDHSESATGTAESELHKLATESGAPHADGARKRK